MLTVCIQTEESDRGKNIFRQHRQTIVRYIHCQQREWFTTLLLEKSYTNSCYCN